MSKSFFQSPMLAPARRVIAFSACAFVMVSLPLWAGQNKTDGREAQMARLEHVEKITSQPAIKVKPQQRKETSPASRNQVMVAGW